jgi:hypothetical protein|tara:strand:- start:695 stop:1012 length:318 start_codon:yes stop_codon:yes gene_type:complete
MKVGISVRIDVTKIDKARLYKGEKGTYLDLTTFVDTEEKDQYENNGFISQSVDKEERDQGVKTPILGNVKVFYTGETERVQQQTNKEWVDEYKANSAPITDDIPF